MYRLYRTLTSIASPLVPLLLKRRLARGKEDSLRLAERLGKPSAARRPGRLIWLHAASVGESNAVLPLIAALLKTHPDLHILLTTVTITSAALMAKRLPDRAIHQFAPVDTPSAVAAFIAHWQPDIALWIDSELWPNLIVEARSSGAVTGIINARMSERSADRWQRLAPTFARFLLSGFRLCFAQSRQDADRLTALGMPRIQGIGNLKYDAPELPCDETELAQLRQALGNRAVWLAASTHPGEEEQVAHIHKVLASRGIRLVSVIVPRHAVRGEEIAAALAGFQVSRRSHAEPVTEATELYLADTMGELGLFYRLAPVVFIGGSLVAHGGQNPLEPAKLGCAILAGPHMENFSAVASAMEQEGAMLRVNSPADLEAKLLTLLEDKNRRENLGVKAQAHVREGAGILAAITQELQSLMGSGRS